MRSRSRTESEFLLTCSVRCCRAGERCRLAGVFVWLVDTWGSVLEVGGVNAAVSSTLCEFSVLAGTRAVTLLVPFPSDAVKAKSARRRSSLAFTEEPFCASALNAQDCSVVAVIIPEPLRGVCCSREWRGCANSRA